MILRLLLASLLGLVSCSKKVPSPEEATAAALIGKFEGALEGSAEFFKDHTFTWGAESGEWTVLSANRVKLTTSRAKVILLENVSIEQGLLTFEKGEGTAYMTRK